MGLRKLTNKPTPFVDPVPAERIDCEAVVRSYQSNVERPAASGREEATNSTPEPLPASIGTDLQTPPPAHREFVDFDNDETTIAAAPAVPAPSSPATAPSDSTDAFTAALNALRTTLRHSSATPQPAVEPVAEAAAKTELTPPEKSDVPREARPLNPIESDSASALERMPLPTSEEGFVPTSSALYQASPVNGKRKSSQAKPPVQREPVTMDNALQAVRDAVPGLNLTPPKSDTPTVGRKQPSSDGIPKSVSEDLPKYPARPKMRTCTRCGNETKLRDAKCQKCNYVDESLGILDAVIAGDLARVEQVLLVRPHLITLRTSRHEWTLLHMAASGGNPKMVDLLIEKGASVNCINRDGKTALHYAAGKGHAGIVQTLLKHLADATVLYNGKSALDLARKNGHREVEDLLRQSPPAE